MTFLPDLFQMLALDTRTFTGQITYSLANCIATVPVAVLPP